ncbi:hypothetical protein ACFLV5_00400 [Chloroflexota bacterium]
MEVDIVTTAEIDLENEALANKYRPLLVLYPEVEDGSKREAHHHEIGDWPGRPPLDQDYHPRDIRLILDHARLPGIDKRSTRDQVLDAMSDNKVKYIDIIDARGPKHVDVFWDAYAKVHNKDNNSDYHRKAYARIVRGKHWFKEYISLQYWMAYFFDDWANVHEMDWEMVSIIIKKTESIEKPIACVFNAHVGSFRRPWKEVDKAGDDGKRNPEGLHPVAYIANGSHAAYFSDYPPYFCVVEKYLKPALSTVVRVTQIGRPFTDYVPRFEEADKCFPEVEVIPEPTAWTGRWRWLSFNGNWGSPVELSFSERIISRIPLIRRFNMFFQRPLRESVPKGPNTRGICWDEPFNWANLESLDAPEDTPWIIKIQQS